MNKLCEAINCLSDSPQRLQILDALDGAYADPRDLKAELDSPRSTLQRNLSVLDEWGWIEKTPSGYTTTTTGCLLREEVVGMNETAETIQRMAPFLDAVDECSEIDIQRLNDPLVMTPDPAQPDMPMRRLFEIFEDADSVRGFIPVVPYFVAELFTHTDRNIDKHEYIVSDDTFDALDEEFPDEQISGSEKDQSARITIRLYEDTLPYGLFISTERLALTAYDENGRIQALVESTNEEAIEWGERMYEVYRGQSTQPDETYTSPETIDAELVH